MDDLGAGNGEHHECGYCYGTHPTAINEDGSLIICTNCRAGLAPLDRVIQAGSWDQWESYIETQFRSAFGKDA